jgi:hypothetical protein
MYATPVVSIQYATIKIQSDNAQHFIKANLKRLHVSAVQGGHHQAIHCRMYRKKLYSCMIFFFCILKYGLMMAALYSRNM